MWRWDARSESTTLQERICVGLRHGRMGEAPGKESGYTRLFLVKSAQAIETKRDAFLLWQESERVSKGAQQRICPLGSLYGYENKGDRLSPELLEVNRLPFAEKHPEDTYVATGRPSPKAFAVSGAM